MGKRTRDIRVCSAVPEPNAPPRKITHELWNSYMHQRKCVFCRRNEGPEFCKDQYNVLGVTVRSVTIVVKFRNCRLQVRFYNFNLRFSNPCIILKFIKKNPTRCNDVSKPYYSIFIWCSTCFGQHTAHRQEPKTALTASSFS